ncbi:MAG TPA: metallophosphoesterase [Bacteroidales bacterium]|nr:metallophosphoesterase [Bacteroidales bacterium]
MNWKQLAVFLTVFFVIYLGISYYIFQNGLVAMRSFGSATAVTIYIIVFVLAVMMYPLVRIVGKWLPVKLSDALSLAGGMWFAAMLYFTLLLLAIDFVYLLAQWIEPAANYLDAHLAIINAVTFSIVILVVIIMIIYGYQNALRPKMQRLSLDLYKPIPGLRKLQLVFASDIHLGHIIGRHTLQRLVDAINAENPDLVLFPGDLVDEELQPVIDKDLGVIFEQLKSKYGVFAVTGNHEYIGGADKAVEYLTRHGIRFLRDEAVEIDSAFALAGREDASSSNFIGTKRKRLKEILSGINPQLPIIVMDHQPIALQEAADNGTCLQISGHTHHGQMWPLQAITRRVFRLSRGYMKIMNTHFYVSTGAGTWGPRVRIGNHPEVVSITLLSR